jgi:hypothetical protein
VTASDLIGCKYSSAAAILGSFSAELDDENKNKTMTQAVILWPAKLLTRARF